MKQYKRIAGEVDVRVFPDSGPEQGEIARWIKANGGQAHLYDGNVEHNVKTSTDATWRWRYISIAGANKWASVGDYIVKDVDGVFRVFSPAEFANNFNQ